MPAIWLIVPLLFGCAHYEAVGAIPKGKAYLSADSTVVLQITPLGAPALEVTPDRLRPLALWLPEGTYSVAFFCGIVASGDNIVSITTNDRGTSQLINVAAGRHYHLACAKNVPEVLRVDELGAAPNKSFKPKPLRGSA